MHDLNFAHLGWFVFIAIWYALKKEWLAVLAMGVLAMISLPLLFWPGKAVPVWAVTTSSAGVVLLVAIVAYLYLRRS